MGTDTYMYGVCFDESLHHFGVKSGFGIRITEDRHVGYSLERGKWKIELRMYIGTSKGTLWCVAVVHFTFINT